MERAGTGFGARPRPAARRGALRAALPRHAPPRGPRTRRGTARRATRLGRGARRGRGGRVARAPSALLRGHPPHRAVSDPGAIRPFDLDGYDGVLAFGEALAQVYRR